MTIIPLVILLTALALAISAPAMAKKPEAKGNGPDTRQINSNKQSDAFSTRGRQRA